MQTAPLNDVQSRLFKTSPARSVACILRNPDRTTCWCLSALVAAFRCCNTAWTRGCSDPPTLTPRRITPFVTMKLTTYLEAHLCSSTPPADSSKADNRDRIQLIHAWYFGDIPTLDNRQKELVSSL